MKDKRFNCYDCIYGSDKCENKDSDQYDKFLIDIQKCNLVGEIGNSLVCRDDNTSRHSAIRTFRIDVDV